MDSSCDTPRAELSEHPTPVPPRFFLAGLAAEYCVGFSALDGVQEGFEAFVFEDAVQALGGEHYDNMHKAQSEAGIKFITTADVVI